MRCPDVLQRRRWGIRQPFLLGGRGRRRCDPAVRWRQGTYAVVSMRLRRRGDHWLLVGGPVPPGSAAITLGSAVSVGRPARLAAHHHRLVALGAPPVRRRRPPAPPRGGARPPVAGAGLRAVPAPVP